MAACTKPPEQLFRPALDGGQMCGLGVLRATGGSTGKQKGNNRVRVKASSRGEKRWS